MILEMRMIPQPEQTVYLIPEYKVAKVLEQASPFRGSIPAKADILAYLTKVNGSLVERHEEREMLYEKYVTAAAIYACVRHIMHLHLPEKLPSTFTTIAGRKPYRLHAPLEIVLTKTKEDIEHTIIEPFFNAQLIDIEEEMPRDMHAVFTTSEFIQEKLARRLKETTNRLQHEHEYNERDHLLFVGIRDICFPLFGIGQRGKEYHEYRDMSIRIQQHYGHFKLKVPLCLAPEHEEAA